MSTDFKLKKAGIIFLAAISATLLTELAVRCILGFPTYGVEKKLLGIKSSTATSNIFYPHSKYYNVEDGYKVYKRNNLGLYGKDVSWNKNDTLIYVLGSSYLEAAPTTPDSMAVTHFQKLIDLAGEHYKVINLGRSGHDPYDLYFRLAWFEKRFGRGRVILVLDDVYTEWFSRHKHPLSFTLSEKFGKENKILFSKMGLYIFNHSSIFYLLKQGLKSNYIEDNSFLLNISRVDITIFEPNDLFACLIAYQKKYCSDFCLFLIINNDYAKHEIQSFCKLNHIIFYSSPLNTKENKINGNGHLNLAGNRKLGEVLFASIQNSSKL